MARKGAAEDAVELAAPLFQLTRLCRGMLHPTTMGAQPFLTGESWHTDLPAPPRTRAAYVPPNARDHAKQGYTFTHFQGGTSSRRETLRRLRPERGHTPVCVLRKRGVYRRQFTRLTARPAKRATGRCDTIAHSGTPSGA